MYYCGTLQAWYGPGPWLCYIGGQQWTTNVVSAPIAGSQSVVLQPGTLANAESFTRMHSVACYNFFINDRISKLTATTYTPAVLIPVVAPAIRQRLTA